MKPYKIGVDLGGTKTEVILLDPMDAVLLRKRIATPAEEGYAAIRGAIAELISETVQVIPSDAECAIGIGIPGAINRITGLVQNANTTCLIGKPFLADLTTSVGHPLQMENDANCFALAEAISGAAKGYGLVFGIIMGTGCGGGLCINKKVRTGPHGIAGEWGHLTIDPLGMRCYCGNRGCVETKISGSGVEASHFEKFGRRLSMEEITTAFRQGDGQATETFLQFLDDFGRSLGGLISILDPDAVVLGGGLSNIEELYTMGIERVKAYAFHDNLQTPILKNRLGDSAGVFGAAWIGV